MSVPFAGSPGCAAVSARFFLRSAWHRGNGSRAPAVGCVRTVAPGRQQVPPSMNRQQTEGGAR